MLFDKDSGVVSFLKKTVAQDEVSFATLVADDTKLPVERHKCCINKSCSLKQYIKRNLRTIIFFVETYLDLYNVQRHLYSTVSIQQIGTAGNAALVCQKAREEDHALCC